MSMRARPPAPRGAPHHRARARSPGRSPAPARSGAGHRREQGNLARRSHAGAASHISALASSVRRCRGRPFPRVTPPRRRDVVVRAALASHRTVGGRPGQAAPTCALRRPMRARPSDVMPLPDPGEERPRSPVRDPAQTHRRGSRSFHCGRVRPRTAPLCVPLLGPSLSVPESLPPSSPSWGSPSFPLVIRCPHFRFHGGAQACPVPPFLHQGHLVLRGGPQPPFFVPGPACHPCCVVARGARWLIRCPAPNQAVAHRVRECPSVAARHCVCLWLSLQEAAVCARLSGGLLRAGRGGRLLRHGRVSRSCLPPRVRPSVGGCHGRPSGPPGLRVSAPREGEEAAAAPGGGEGRGRRQWAGARCGAGGGVCGGPEAAAGRVGSACAGEQRPPPAPGPAPPPQVSLPPRSGASPGPWPLPRWEPVPSRRDPGPSPGRPRDAPPTAAPHSACTLSSPPKTYGCRGGSRHLEGLAAAASAPHRLWGPPSAQYPVSPQVRGHWKTPPA